MLQVRLDWHLGNWREASALWCVSFSLGLRTCPCSYCLFAAPSGPQMVGSEAFAGRLMPLSSSNNPEKRKSAHPVYLGQLQSSYLRGA